jgi:hypothetical protein
MKIVIDHGDMLILAYSMDVSCVKMHKYPGFPLRIPYLLSFQVLSCTKGPPKVT